MEKDRDISRAITISTPNKVGFVGTAFLVGSAFVAACGGGSSKPSNTPEGGVAGAAVQPGGGASPIVVETAMPSSTAVIEAPTAAPTAANSEVLSPQELLNAGTEVSGIFADAFDGLDVSAVGFDKVSQPVERDLQSVQNAIGICTGAVPYPYRDEAERQRMAQDVTLLAGGISGFCEIAGESSLGFYNAIGREQFKQANMLMEKIHYSVVKDFQKKDPRIKGAFWQSLKGRFYPFGATGTSN